VGTLSVPAFSTSFASYAANSLVFGSIKTYLPGQVTVYTTEMSPVGGNRYPGDIPDGTSNTIFWSDKVAYCEGNGGPGGTLWAENRVGSPLLPITPPAGSTVAPLNTLMGSPLGFQTNVVQSGQCSYLYPSSGHAGVLMVALGDGSVRSLVTATQPATFTQAMIPNDQTPLGADW
jgi:hypothetical protein